MQIKKQQLEWNMEQCVGSKQGKKYNKAVYCHLAECITQNARLDEAQGGMKVEGRNINNLRYADDTTLMVWRGFKEPPDEGERGEWKAGLKLNIQNTKIVAPDSITSWQVDGEDVEPVADFLFLGSKITVDCDCSHKIKTHFLPERKAVINLDSILKSRGITLLTKVWIVRSMVYSLVMDGCENWTIKKAECWKMDAFKLWC